jgi:hypothetical protein
MRVVMVADFPTNSPFGFRPAPGARFRVWAIVICLHEIALMYTKRWQSQQYRFSRTEV